MTDDDIKKLFAKLDKTNTGFINQQDYRMALKGYATDQSIRDTILEMDQNLDGQISLQEFLSHMKKSILPETTFTLPEQAKDIDWFEMFVHFDQDYKNRSYFAMREPPRKMSSVICTECLRVLFKSPSRLEWWRF